MENEIANKLKRQPNFQATVKLLHGEEVVQTNEGPLGLSGSRMTGLTNRIKTQMRAQGYCRNYLEVEREMRARQEKWINGGIGKERPGGPPPSYT